MISQKLKNNEKHMSELQNGFEKIKISSMDLNNYHLHKEIVNCEKKFQSADKVPITAPYTSL